eukprot:667862-Hanusia_phi.AAC.1
MGEEEEEEEEEEERRRRRALTLELQSDIGTSRLSGCFLHCAVGGCARDSRVECSAADSNLQDDTRI